MFSLEINKNSLLKKFHDIVIIEDLLEKKKAFEQYVKDYSIELNNHYLNRTIELMLKNIDIQLKENELKENELKENELKENELNENELNENELTENELNENELTENELNENELNENELKEIELKEIELKEIKLKEIKLKEKDKIVFMENIDDEPELQFVLEGVGSNLRKSGLFKETKQINNEDKDEEQFTWEI